MVAPNGQPTLPQSSMDDYAVEGLPELSTAGNRFVSTYIHSGFDLAAAAKAAQLPLSHANHYTTDAAIQAHIESHFRFLHTTHQCKATTARDFLIDELIKFLPQVTDPREKRLLFQQLHRATSVPIAPFPRSGRKGAPRPDDTGTGSDEDTASETISRSELQDQRSNVDDAESESQSHLEDSEPRIKAPRASVESPQPPIEDPRSRIEDPRSNTEAPLPIIENSDTPSQIVPKLLAALNTPDQPWPDADLTVIADAVEFDAEIDGEPVGYDDEDEIIEALADTSLLSLRSHRAARHLESINHSDRQATEIWLLETAAGHVKVTIDFARSLETDAASLSRFPGRWMIKQIITTPEPPPEKTHDSPPEDG